MNRCKDQEEWMLMQQRQKKSRAQSLPHSALGIQIGQRGPKIINTNTGPKKVANYINKIPKVIQLQNQNQPCIKLDCSETLFETASSEIKTSSEKDGNDCKQILPSSYRDENLLSLEKNHEIRSSQMSTLQLPDMGRNIEIIFQQSRFFVVLTLLMIVHTPVKLSINFMFFKYQLIYMIKLKTKFSLVKLFMDFFRLPSAKKKFLPFIIYRSPI